jgi:hypothetical protein
MNLVAYSGNVRLVEDQLSGLPPALAQFAASGRQRQQFADGAQDAPVLGRKGLGELLGELRGRHRHAAYLGSLGPELSRWR